MQNTVQYIIQKYVVNLYRSYSSVLYSTLYDPCGFRFFCENNAPYEFTHFYEYDKYYMYTVL